MLHETLDKGADLEAALGRNKNFDRLEGPDRGFARAIAGAALRGLGRIDWALGGMLDRPMADIQPEVRALLRAGAAQMWMLGVADHAAVSATVEAARRWPGAAKGGGLVNAVLRRASRETEAFGKAPPTSVWPDWLAAKLKSALGPERADAMAELQLEEPPIDLYAETGRRCGRACRDARRRTAGERYGAPEGWSEARRPAGLCGGRLVGAGRGAARWR